MGLQEFSIVPLPAPLRVPEPELEQLLALVTPADTCRGMYFPSVLEAVRQLGGDSAWEKCLAASEQKKFVDFSPYPVATFLKVIFTAANMLGPRMGGREVVFRQLGRKGTQAFYNSTVGKTLDALGGMTPRGVISNIPNSYKVSTSYGERQVEWLGERHARLQVRREFLPGPYQEGVLTYVVERTTARNVVISTSRISSLDMDHDITWEE
jgi:uncharacterized protein (TIGR02265 family)